MATSHHNHLAGRAEAADAALLSLRLQVLSDSHAAIDAAEQLAHAAEQASQAQFATKLASITPVVDAATNAEAASAAKFDSQIALLQQVMAAADHAEQASANRATQGFADSSRLAEVDQLARGATQTAVDLANLTGDAAEKQTAQQTASKAATVREAAGTADRAEAKSAGLFTKQATTSEPAARQSWRGKGMFAEAGKTAPRSADEAPTTGPGAAPAA